MDRKGKKRQSAHSRARDDVIAEKYNYYKRTGNLRFCLDEGIRFLYY